MNNPPAQGPAGTTVVAFGGALGFAYSPQHTSILPGDTIRWLGDFAAHSLVGNDGLWQQVGNGTEYSFTFDQPGRYSYHGLFHSNSGMNRNVTVGGDVFLTHADQLIHESTGLDILITG